MNNVKMVLCICLFLLNLQANAQYFDCNRMDNKILAKISKLNRISQSSSDFELLEKEKKAKEEYATQLWKKGKKQEAMCVLTSIPDYIVSQYKLGELHYISKEYDKAFALFKQSLDSQGYDGYDSNKSLYYLGELYEKGWGTKKDDKQALRNYLASAYSGDEKAMLKLSELYKKGILVDKDEIHGKFWLQGYFNQQYENAEIKKPKKIIAVDNKLISNENQEHWVVLPIISKYLWFFDLSSVKLKDEKGFASYKMKFIVDDNYFDDNVDKTEILSEVSYDCNNKQIHSVNTTYKKHKATAQPTKEIQNYELNSHKTPINYLFDDLCK